MGSGLPNPSRPPSLNITGSNDASSIEPTILDLIADETISPSSASIHPGSYSRATITSHNFGVPSQGAQSTTNDVPLRDAVMRMLGQNPTRQRVFQVQQEFYTYLDEVLAVPTAAPTRVGGVQIPPPPPRPPSVNEPIRRQRRKPLPRVAYRCRDRECDQDEECGVTAVNKQSFRRHVENKHYPQYDYHCGVESCTAFLAKPLHRPDKLLKHYPDAHGLGRPSDSIIEANRHEHPCPPFCPLCSRLVGDWEDFYDCFLSHCRVKPAPSKASSPRDTHRRRKKRRDRDNSDKGNFNGGTDNGGFVSQQGYGYFGNAGETINPWPSGYDGYQQGQSHQQGGCNQHHSWPELDVRNFQDQPTSQASRSHCKSCQHPFENCSSCFKSPPSTLLCHACPDAQRALAMQAGVLDTGPSRELLPHTGQTMRVADHAETKPQAFYDVNSSIPIIAAANSLLYGALPQEPQQLNMRLQQQARAYGLPSATDTQKSPVSSKQSLAVGAVRDVQAVGIFVPRIGPFISDSKSKKAQTSDNWSGVLTLRGSSPPARKPPTGVNIATPLLIGPLSSNKVNPSSVCQCPCRTSSPGTYFARSRMDIAPGRRIEMDFKMTPEARPGLGYPLRTRIHVVVKILRLRSSVARLTNEKHKREAPVVLKETGEVPLEIIKTVEPFEEEEKEKEIELTFDLDLQSSLKKLSSWTILPTGNPFSDLSVQDQYRVFEFFGRCMLFIFFVTAAIARAQDYNPSNSCLAKRRPGHLCHTSYYSFDTRSSHMIC